MCLSCPYVVIVVIWVSRWQLFLLSWSILSQLHELMQSTSLEAAAAIETLVGAYLEIYDRDNI